MKSNLKKIDIDFIDFLYNDTEEVNNVEVLSEDINTAELANNLDIRVIGPGYPGFDPKYMEPNVFVMASNSSINFDNMVYNNSDSDELIWRRILSLADKFGGRYLESHQLLDQPGFMFSDRSNAVSFVAGIRSIDISNNIDDIGNDTTEEVDRVLDEYDPGVEANGLLINVVKMAGMIAAVWSWGEESGHGKWLYISSAPNTRINPWEIVEYLSKHDQEIAGSGKLANLVFKGEDPDIAVPAMKSGLEYITILSSDGLLLGKNPKTWSHMFGE